MNGSFTGVVDIVQQFLDIDKIFRIALRYCLFWVCSSGVFPFGDRSILQKQLSSKFPILSVIVVPIFPWA